MPPAQVVRAGDTVLHRPSGETWTVASVEGLHFYACGWPETRALLSDAELVEACTDEEHEDTLRRVAASDGNGSGRAVAARRELAGRRLAAEAA